MCRSWLRWYYFMVQQWYFLVAWSPYWWRGSCMAAVMIVLWCAPCVFWAQWIDGVVAVLFYALWGFKGVVLLCPFVVIGQITHTPCGLRIVVIVTGTYNPSCFITLPRYKGGAGAFAYGCHLLILALPGGSRWGFDVLPPPQNSAPNTKMVSQTPKMMSWTWFLMFWTPKRCLDPKMGSMDPLATDQIPSN